MIPYVELSRWSLFGRTLPVFGPLAVLGALFGHFTLLRYAERARLGTRVQAEIFTMAIVSSSVVTSYAAGASLAGLAAGAVTAFGVCRVFRLPFLGMLDAMFYALPFGWLFLRAGCALVHDHVGLASTSALAVAFPSGSAFDLGVLEFLLAPFFLLFAVIAARKPRPLGHLGASIGIAFATMRFFVNFASADKRMFGLTFFQWVCLVVSLSFLALFRPVDRTRPTA